MVMHVSNDSRAGDKNNLESNLLGASVFAAAQRAARASRGAFERQLSQVFISKVLEYPEDRLYE